MDHRSHLCPGLSPPFSACRQPFCDAERDYSQVETQYWSYGQKGKGILFQSMKKNSDDGARRFLDSGVGLEQLTQIVGRSLKLTIVVVVASLLERRGSDEHIIDVNQQSML